MCVCVCSHTEKGGHNEGNDKNLQVVVELSGRHMHRWGIRDQWSFLFLQTFIKTEAFVKVTVAGGRGGVYCDSNALYCAALRDRTESKGKQVKEGKGTKKKKLRQTRLWKTESMALDPASPKKCCQSKEAEHCPTSCVGPMPEHSAANINSTLVYTSPNTQIDAYAHIRICAAHALIPYKL